MSEKQDIQYYHIVLVRKNSSWSNIVEKQTLACVKMGLESRRLRQTWIHTGFHRFTEIGQIFHNKYFFNNKKHFPSLNLGNILPEWLEKPRKGDFKS